MEPTCNAWVPLAAWFRRHGATMVLVPPERSADLRVYYANHTMSDRLDPVILARLPMLQPTPDLERRFCTFLPLRGANLERQILNKTPGEDARAELEATVEACPTEALSVVKD